MLNVRRIVRYIMIYLHAKIHHYQPPATFLGPRARGQMEAHITCLNKYLKVLNQANRLLENVSSSYFDKYTF